MPINIYIKEFQNWLKGVLGLNTTRTALCECITDTLDAYLKDVSPQELKQFFICLDINNISRLKTKVKGRCRVWEWECSHERCNALMGRFVHNHTHSYQLKYKWNKSSNISDDADRRNEHQKFKWRYFKLFKLYMHLDNNYTSLEDLDISHVIKAMRNCKLFYPDGSAEPYDEVLKLRNTVMHSPNNTMELDETLKLLNKTRKLLDCLDIAEKTYYKKAIAELQDLERNDFVLKYRSEESEFIIAKVLEARIVADELHSNIEDNNQLCKSQSKRLQDMLEQIVSSGITTKRGFEMTQAEYKVKVKQTMEQKRKTIALDKIVFDEKSNDYKTLENLERKTEVDIKEMEVQMTRTGLEEMVDVINSLNKELGEKNAKEIGLKKKLKESTKEIENLNTKLEYLEQERKLLFYYQLVCRHLKVDGVYLSYDGKGNAGAIGIYVDKRNIDSINNFEIEISSLGKNGSIACGLVPKHCSNDQLPGLLQDCIGYHSNGKLYRGGTELDITYQKAWQQGDRIRFQINETDYHSGYDRSVDVSINGDCLKSTHIGHNLHLSIGMKSVGAKVKVAINA